MTKEELQKLVDIANEGYKAIEKLWNEYPDQIQCHTDLQDWTNLSEFHVPAINRKLRVK